MDDLILKKYLECKRVDKLNNDEKMALENYLLDEVKKHRREIENILENRDDRMLIIVGPCSIHNIEEAKEYTNMLSDLNNKVKEELKIVMRVYGDKPRTTIGWKGYRRDPNLDGSNNITQGIKELRELKKYVTLKGLGVAEETLYPEITNFTKDLISYHAMGARSSEHQPLREYFSSLEAPVGIKHPTCGSLKKGSESVYSITNSHQIINQNSRGELELIETKGNKFAHLILRGGDNGRNLNCENVKQAKEELEKLGVKSNILIDVSHSNSVNNEGKKDYLLQISNVEHVLDYLKREEDLSKIVKGFMIESYINSGNQKISKKEELKYGVSITDSCINFEDTKELLNKCQKYIVEHRHLVNCRNLKVSNY